MLLNGVDKKFLGYVKKLFIDDGHFIFISGKVIAYPEEIDELIVDNVEMEEFNEWFKDVLFNSDVNLDLDDIALTEMEKYLIEKEKYMLRMEESERRERMKSKNGCEMCGDGGCVYCEPHRFI